MALNVYLDTNVFDHILKKIDFTDADLQLLKNAISDGKISILRSVTLVEEILPAINASDPELANRKKQLLMELTDPSKLVKYHTELLRDDLNAFVNGTGLPSPFTDEFPNILDELTPQASEVMVQKEVLRQTKEQKELVKQGFKDAKKESLVAIEELIGGKYKTQPGDWKRFVELGLPGYVHELIEKLGLPDECKETVVDGVLKIRSLRIYIMSSLSYVYAHTFEGYEPHTGDSRDLHHAVLASAADVYVTQDAKVRTIMKRVDVPGFEVMALQNLLQKIASL
jgi:hypothetical protein